MAAGAGAVAVEAATAAMAGLTLTDNSKVDGELFCSLELKFSKVTMIGGYREKAKPTDTTLLIDVINRAIDKEDKSFNCSFHLMGVFTVPRAAKFNVAKSQWSDATALQSLEGVTVASVLKSGSFVHTVLHAIRCPCAPPQ